MKYTPTRFNCPIVIQNLEKEFGSKSSEEEISMRESDDVLIFLKAKQESERKSLEIERTFKSSF